MARDALRDVFPVNVAFVDGEQPGSPKFDGWANQTNNGLAMVASTIGDVWGDEFGSNKLYPHRARPANIANLARLIGPASALNPMRQSRQTLAVTIDPSVIIPSFVNEFQLPVVPIEFYGVASGDPDKALHRPDSSIAAGSIFDLLTTLDAGVFNPAGRKASRDLVLAAGDWAIDMMGRVYTYTLTNAYAPAALLYRASMHWEFHDGQRGNVYPDWNDLVNFCSAFETGAGTGVYNIDLPMVATTPRERNIAYGTNQWEPGDTTPSDSLYYTPPTPFQAFLPHSLLQTIAPGGAIPEGYMQVWDNTLGQIVDNLTFTLVSSIRVSCTGAALSAAATFPGTDATRYRLVTAGTTVTESIQEHAWKIDNHQHDDKILGGAPIKHSNLSWNHIESAAVGGAWGTIVTSPPSAIVGNDHPQYLSRYGWQTLVDPGQYDNAMLGDLFMATGYADYTANAYDNGLATSHAAIFGTTGNYIDADTAGIFGYNLHLKSANNFLWLESPNVVIGNPAGGGPTQINIMLSESLANSGTLQWNSPTTNETGFAFLQSGAVVNAQTQMGQLWVHHENAAIDVGPPFPTGGAINTYARLWCGNPDGGFPATAESTLRLYNFSGGADRWCGMSMTGLSGILATNTADLYINSDQDLFLWANAVSGKIDMVSQDVDMNITQNIIANVGNIIQITANNTMTLNVTNNDMNFRANNGFINATVNDTAGAFEINEDDGLNSYVRIKTTDGLGNDYQNIRFEGDTGEWLRLFHDATNTKAGFQCDGVGDSWGFQFISFDRVEIPHHAENEAAMGAVPNGSMYYDDNNKKLRVMINNNWRTVDVSP